MNKTNYGFRVLSEEQAPDEWISRLFPQMVEGTRTIFVEVDLTTPAYCEQAYCSFYYGSHRAKTVIVPEGVLKVRFPKSWKQGDIHEEYNSIKEW